MLINKVSELEPEGDGLRVKLLDLTNPENPTVPYCPDSVKKALDWLSWRNPIPCEYGSPASRIHQREHITDIDRDRICGSFTGFVLEDGMVTGRFTPAGPLADKVRSVIKTQNSELQFSMRATVQHQQDLQSTTHKLHEIISWDLLILNY